MEVRPHLFLEFHGLSDAAVKEQAEIAGGRPLFDYENIMLVDFKILRRSLQ